MTRIMGVMSVEVTFEDGLVKHFQIKTGDLITMTKQDTLPPYYTLIIAPVEKSQ